MASANQAGDVSVESAEVTFPLGTSNAIRMYHALDREMMTKKRKSTNVDDKEACVEAERIAKVCILSQIETQI